MSVKDVLSKIKNFALRYEGIISWLIIIVLFFTGYTISNEFIVKTNTNEEFEYCEKVAKSIYDQRNEYIIEIPDDIIFKKESTRITVRKKWHSGSVVTTLKNGELFYQRNSEIGMRMTLNILLGIVLSLITILIISGIDYKREKKTIERGNKFPFLYLYVTKLPLLQYYVKYDILCT